MEFSEKFFEYGDKPVTISALGTFGFSVLLGRISPPFLTICRGYCP
jgi:hypothetical protein